MRNLFALLSLFGLAGLVFGVLTIVRHSTGPHGTAFNYENYGGPGTIIAGLVLAVGGCFLWSVWPRLDRR